MPIVSISMDRLLCSLLIAPKGKKRRTIPISFGAGLPDWIEMSVLPTTRDDLPHFPNENSAWSQVENAMIGSEVGMAKDIDGLLREFADGRTDLVFELDWRRWTGCSSSAAPRTTCCACRD
jgi:hypothetical protein